MGGEGTGVLTRGGANHPGGGDPGRRIGDSGGEGLVARRARAAARSRLRSRSTLTSSVAKQKIPKCQGQL